MVDVLAHDPGPEVAAERAEAHATAAREPLALDGATVRIGTASWTDPTMTASGVFYPPDATTAEDWLVYYSTTSTTNPSSVSGSRASGPPRNRRPRSTS